MPPKGIVPNLFGERKVYIGKDLCDMKHLEESSFEVSAFDGDGCTDENGIDITAELATPVDFSMFFQTRPMTDAEKKLIRLLTNPKGGTIHIIFVLHRRRKQPKLTYKTLRHDCAKRNGRI